MADSIPPDTWFARASRPPGLLGRLASLALVLEVALALRVATADAVEWYVRRGPPRLDLFPDTDIYWELARAIRAGGPYEYVEWGDIPHFAIRTPGYPLLLAASQAVFGERTLPIRLVQAALGTLCVYLVYHLARQLASTDRDDADMSPRRRGNAPLIAAAVAAVNPHYLVMSSLVLSEAAFEPLMLAALLGVAVLWPAGRRPRPDRGLAVRDDRPGQRRGRRRGRAGPAIVGAVRPGDAGRLGRRGTARRAESGRGSRRGRLRGGPRPDHGAVVGPQRADLRPVRADRPLAGRQPVRWSESPGDRRQRDDPVLARSGDLAARRAGPGRRADPPRDRVRPR